MIEDTEKLRDEEMIAEVLCGASLGGERRGLYASVNADTDCQSALESLSNQSDRMRMLKENRANREIVCYKKLLRPFIVFFRKLLRKFVLKWYVEPICEQQTEFNTAASKAVNDMEKLAYAQLQAIGMLTKKNEVLEKALAEEKEKVKSLEERISALESGKKE